MSRFSSFDSLQRENRQLRGDLSQVEQAYESIRVQLNSREKELKKAGENFDLISKSHVVWQNRFSSLEEEFTKMRTDYDGLRSVANSQLRFGSLAKSTHRQLRTPPPEREKEVEPEAGAKRSWASGLEERKWRRVGSPEPSEVEGSVVGDEKVGGALDPEKEEGIRLPVMVKVGGVRWSDGIGGVLAGLQGSGIMSCEGSQWLVGKEERERRRRGGSKSSTVLLKVLGVEAARVLCSSGLWVGGYWCSVRRFVAIPPRRKDKGWVDRFSLLADKLENVRRGLARVEGVVKKEDVEVEDVRLPREWKKGKEREKEVEERMEERFQRMMAQEGSCWMADAELGELIDEEEKEA